MIVWRITANEIGPGGCGAYYFTTQADALEHWHENGTGGPAPLDKIVVKNRSQLADELNAAMGFGGT